MTVSTVSRSNPQRLAALKWYARAASVLVVLVSCIVLIGWLTRRNSEAIYPGWSR